MHLNHSCGINNTKYARKRVVYWYFDIHMNKSVCNQTVLLL